MLCYRTPASLKEKFDRSINIERNLFNTETWLLHHGEKLQNRFTLEAYKLMNQLVKTIDICKDRGGICSGYGTYYHSNTHYSYRYRFVLCPRGKPIDL